MKIIVEKYGAIPNIESEQTSIFQNAIDDLTSNGGGILVFENGSYVTGSLQLKDNVQIHVAHGSSITGSKQIASYPDLPPHFHTKEKCYAWKALIWADNAENIAISGSGTIDGSGGADEFQVEREEFWARVQNRPIGFYFYRCSKVLFENISMKNSAFWMHHHVECSKMNFNNVTLHNHCNYNNDGIDLDNCRDVIINNCHIDACDDALCFKSMTPDLNSNIVVSNSILRSHYNSLKIGSETATGLNGLTVTNCILSGSEYPNKITNSDSRAVSGISLMSCDGADLQNISISNCHINDVMVPLYIRRQSRKRSLYTNMPEVNSPGVVKNITISNITAENITHASSIMGVSNYPVENIIIENWHIDYPGGETKTKWAEVSNRDGEYPDCTNSGEQYPAIGFYLSNVKNISFRNINLESNKEDSRPLFFFDKQSVIQNNSCCRVNGTPI